MILCKLYMYQGFFNFFAQYVSKFVWTLNKLASSLYIQDLALRECKNFYYFNIIVGHSLSKKVVAPRLWLGSQSQAQHTGKV